MEGVKWHPGLWVVAGSTWMVRVAMGSQKSVTDSGLSL